MFVLEYPQSLEGYIVHVHYFILILLLELLQELRVQGTEFNETESSNQNSNTGQSNYFMACVNMYLMLGFTV